MLLSNFNNFPRKQNDTAATVAESPATPMTSDEASLLLSGKFCRRLRATSSLWVVNRQIARQTITSRRVTVAEPSYRWSQLCWMPNNSPDRWQILDSFFQFRLYFILHFPAGSVSHRLFIKDDQSIPTWWDARATEVFSCFVSPFWVIKKSALTTKMGGGFEENTRASAQLDVYNLYITNVSTKSLLLLVLCSWS